MAFYLFSDDLALTEEEFDNPHMGPMYVGGLLYNTLIFTAVGMVCVQLVGSWVDANMYPGKRVRK